MAAADRQGKETPTRGAEVLEMDEMVGGGKKEEWTGERLAGYPRYELEAMGMCMGREALGQESFGCGCDWIRVEMVSRAVH